MALLFYEKQKTRKSICELLRLAVHMSYGDKLNCVKSGDIEIRKEINNEEEKEETKS